MRIFFPAFLGSLLLFSIASFAGPLTTEAQIRQAIVGNTISGTEKGKAYLEYFQGDGFIHGRDAEGPYVGQWRISRGQLCMSYFEEDKTVSAWECSRVALEGSRLAWLDDEGREYSDVIMGNPNKL